MLGSLHRIGLHDSHLTLEGWRERYGPLYTFRAGPRRYVVVADREAANEILRDRPEGFRRPREVESVFKEMHIHGVFSAEGVDWRRQRRLARERQLDGIAESDRREYPGADGGGEDLHRSTGLLLRMSR